MFYKQVNGNFIRRYSLAQIFSIETESLLWKLDYESWYHACEQCRNYFSQKFCRLYTLFTDYLIVLDTRIVNTLSCKRNIIVCSLIDVFLGVKQYSIIMSQVKNFNYCKWDCTHFQSLICSLQGITAPSRLRIELRQGAWKSIGISLSP